MRSAPLAFLVSSMLTVPLWAAAQTAAPIQRAPELVAAQGYMRAQQYDSAAVLLERLTARDPENAQAWAMLGNAYHSKGDIDRAIPAHQRATAFPATAPNATRRLGLAYARKGDLDRAFEVLMKAKAGGRVDLTALDLDPDSEHLRGDPRYRALFPTDAELADPFVEPVRILHEWRGETVGDQFGWIAHPIGDVNGDGVQEITTSAPTWGDNAGKVYTYDGRTGASLWTRAGEPQHWLGLGLDAAHDVNADGVPDVVASARGAGKVLVFSGRDGSTVLELAAPASGEEFGHRAAGLGDADRDGHADIAVGAPGSDSAGENAGRVYLYSGRTGALLRSWDGSAAGAALGRSLAGGTIGERVVVVSGEPGAFGGNGGRVRVFDAAGDERFTMTPDSSAVQFGLMFASVVGDVDADGMADVWSTDFADAAKGPATGRAYVVSGADGSRLLTFEGEGPGEGFGVGSAKAGDVDGDGHDDIVAGAWQHASAAPSGGRIYVYSGRDGSLLRTITGKIPGETLGFDATGTGDVNGDGKLDLLVTSAWSIVSGAQSGRVYVVSGQ